MGSSKRSFRLRPTTCATPTSTYWRHRCPASCRQARSSWLKRRTPGSTSRLRRGPVESGKGDQMLTTLRSMLREEDGATMVEYGLLVALIALVSLGAIQTLGINLSSMFTNVGTSL